MFKVLSTLLLTMLVSWNAIAANELAYEIQENALPGTVEVVTRYENGRAIEEVRIKGQEPIALPSQPTEPSDLEVARSLSVEQKAQADGERRYLLTTILKAIQSGMFKGPSVIQDGRIQTVVPTKASLDAADATVAQPLADMLELNKPADKSEAGIKKTNRIKQFVLALNDALFVSTYRAGKEHFSAYRRLTPTSNEWGVELMLKFDVQIGVGKFSLMKTFPFTLKIGYNRDTKRVMMRTGFRQEKMAGGTAFSAGGRIEVRRYRLDSNIAGNGIVGGSAWYPPSIPVASFVFDSAPGYTAEGIVVGLNVGDLIPGTTFMNTVNNFEEKGKVYEPAAISKTVLSKLMNQAGQRAEARTMMPGFACRALFAH